MPLAPGKALIPVGSRFGGFGTAPGSMNGDGLMPPASTKSASASPPRNPATVTNLFIRKTGSDANGGSSASATPDRTGADGVANGTATFTAATGAFTSADINKLVNIVGKGRFRIIAVGSPTSVTLSASPSSGSSLTWNLGGACLTIGSLLTITNTPAGSVLGGDRIWIGAGTYREVVTVGITPTFEVQVNGDFDGSMTGDAGEVRWTSFTTNDRTVPSAVTLLNVVTAAANMTFQHLTLDGGGATVVTSGGSVNLVFRDCLFRASSSVAQQLVSVGTSAATPINHLFERCIFFGNPSNGTTALVQYSSNQSTADFDLNVVFRNCLFMGNGQAIRLFGSGTLTPGTAGGVRVLNCTFYGHPGGGVVVANATFAITNRVSVYGCLFYTPVPMSANVSGQIVEDGNLIWGTSTNVPLGPRSKLNAYWAGVHLGQEMFWGGQPRMPFSPAAGSALLGFLANPVGADLLSGPRPAGGGSGLVAVGALERPNTLAQAASPVPPSGTHVATITGPGYQDFLLPVSATSTTVSVSVQRDASYTGPLPALELLQNGERGIAAAVAPAVGPTGAWETLTLPAFTPATAGWVTLRLHSQDTSGISVVAFANVTVS